LARTWGGSSPRRASAKARKPEKLPTLTLPEALAMQQDLLKGFSDTDFQSKLKELRSTVGTSDQRRFREERNRLFLTVQAVVLPVFGLEGNSKGVLDMLASFEQPHIRGSEDFQRVGALLNQLLFDDEAGELEKASRFLREVSSEVSLRTSAAASVQVRVIPWVSGDTGEEIVVTVPKTAKMSDVKSAISEHLGDDSIPQRCRLVKKKGEIMTAYRDEERLGGTRRLVLLYIDADGHVEEEDGEGVHAQEGELPRFRTNRGIGSTGKSPASRTVQGRRLTVDEALALQQDLLDGFGDASFQAVLKDLKRTLAKSEPRKFKIQQTKLFLSVQSAVLPKHGFEGDMQGVWDMMKAFDEPHLAANEEIQNIGARINHLLHSEEVDDVEVRVRQYSDGHNGAEVVVRVPANSTMRDVRLAVSKVLDSDDVLRQGKLVRKLGELLMRYEDDELLGSRRRLLLTGASLSPQGSPTGGVEAGAAVDVAAVEVVPSGGGWKLTLEEAVDLQEDLKAGYGEAAFQERLTDILAKHEPGSAAWNQQRLELFLTVQSRVLPKYGFSGSTDGIVDMMKLFNVRPEFSRDPEIQRRGQEINGLLRIEPASSSTSRAQTATAKGSKPKPPAQEVEVRVRHAYDFVDVKVTVLENVTMGKLLAALARQVGRPEIAERGRVVQKAPGGQFLSYKDSEPIGKRRRLLFAGASLDPEPAAAPARDASEEVEAAVAAEARAARGVEGIRGLLRSMLRSCSDIAFMESVGTLHRKGHSQAVLRTALGTLFLSTCQGLLSDLGFSSSRAGFDEMFAEVYAHRSDEQVLDFSRSIERVLRVPRGDWFGIVEGQTAETADRSGERRDEEPVEGSEAAGRRERSSAERRDEDLAGEEKLSLEEPLERSEAAEHRERDSVDRRDEVIVEEENAGKEKLSLKPPVERSEAAEHRERDSVERRDEVIVEEAKQTLEEPVERSEATDHGELASPERRNDDIDGEQKQQVEERVDGSKPAGLRERLAKDQAEEQVQAAASAGSEEQRREITSEAVKVEAEAEAEDWRQSSAENEEHQTAAESQEKHEVVQPGVDAELTVDRQDEEKVKAALEEEQHEEQEEKENGEDVDEEEDEEEEDDDPEWVEASRVVSEIGEELAGIAAAMRRAAKKEAQPLLARKRALESAPEYLAAMRYLEDPEAERKRRRLEEGADEAGTEQDVSASSP